MRSYQDGNTHCGRVNADGAVVRPLVEWPAGRALTGILRDVLAVATRRLDHQ